MRSSQTEADYLITCDRSGMIFKRSECLTTWDNKLVAKKFWEPRHPQDIIRAYADRQSVADARNEQPDPSIYDGNLYYDQLLSYEDMLAYEAQSIFNLSLTL